MTISTLKYLVCISKLFVSVHIETAAFIRFTYRNQKILSRKKEAIRKFGFNNPWVMENCWDYDNKHWYINNKDGTCFWKSQPLSVSSGRHVLGSQSSQRRVIPGEWPSLV